MNRIKGNVPVAAGRGRGKLMDAAPSPWSFAFWKRRRLYGTKHERKRDDNQSAR